MNDITAEKYITDSVLLGVSGLIPSLPYYKGSLRMRLDIKLPL